MRIRHLRATTLTAVILILLGNGLYAQGSLTNISVNLSDNKAGEEAIYTFTFTTSSGAGGIPNNGKIEFIFPPGFDVSGVDIAQSKNSNMTGGFSAISIENKASANNDTVRLTRDWTGNNVAGNTEVSIAIGMVVNNTLKASNYEVKINTMTNTKSIIDTGTTPDFSIAAGLLHHFLVVTNGHATAGKNFPVTITAQDQYNNTDISFTGQATLTDKTGTISPTITGTFSNGIKTDSLTFTKSYNNNQITVTYDNKSGNSAVFEVLAGGLDHFAFDTISSPQTAGTSFSITITAQDRYNNTATSFTDKVTLTDGTGTLNTISNNFSNGILTNQNVSITKSQADNFITAYHAGSGISKISNLFNVNSANLSKFYIDTISSPKTAGELFSLVVTAQDQYNNTVNSFNGNVDISDLSNSISPTQSGNFNSGKWTGSVKISSSYNSDRITVKRTGGSEQGNSNNFNVVAGSLDHFNISNVPSQTAGVSFQITITAKDKEGNTVSSFSGPVTIGDLSGTIEPQSSGTFSNGEKPVLVTITGAKQNNQIRVTGSGKSGTSNDFNVNPNSLHHFSFLNISSPQTAGQSFSVTIEASDQYENKVTSFISSVNLSDKTGTLTPTSSGNFSDGSKSVIATITKKVNDNQITASYSGKSGQSNNFNVKSGTVHHIVVRNNPGGLGNEVSNISLNLNNQVVFYVAGYDPWNNYIREVQANWGRTGTLDLPSPLQGTNTTFIPTTPQTSGQIYADSSGMRDYTGTITVGNIHHVLIRDAANGGGNVVNTKIMTADDTLRLYAAAYDEGNNYLGSAIVDWLSSGSLQPAISFSNMSMIDFIPTAAPTSGQIQANHATAIDYTTGTISVNPGAPVGKIVLHPNPKSIPAHPDSFSIISSEVIYDSDGNRIADGTLFTVSTTLGKISSPTDQATGIVGHQVKSNWSSQINFTIKADSIGGTAIIHVNSVGKGSAVGDTTIIISNIQIVSVNADFQKVTQGQINVPVRMTVNNRGTETAVIPGEGASLRFRDSNQINRSGEYVVTRTDTFSVVPGFGGQRILTFDVDISPSAITDSITIDGNVYGTVKGKVVSDTTASLIDRWLVQTAPGLRVERIETATDTVVQGKNAIVTMTIRNDGDAALFIESDSLTFWAVNQGKYVTQEYGQFPIQSNPDTIAGHSSQVFSYSVQVGASATLDTIVINAKVSGLDINTNISYSDFNADFVDGWRVKLAANIQIAKFIPSQITVTSGQASDWYLDMAISNNGGAVLRLDSAKVKFTIGALNISNQYQMVSPDTFLFSENDTLLAGGSDTLRLTIDKTGTTLGTITIEGIVYLNDMISGQIIKSALTGIVVQSPALLKVDYVRTAQPEITVSQTHPWKTIVALTNSGGSEVLIDTTQIQTFISFVGDPNFVVTPPVGFHHSGNFILNAGGSDSLFFTIDTTGNLSGNRQITAKIIGKEINSNRTITVQKNTTVKVELPANIRISNTKSIAPNAPYVDSEQLFQIAVIVENSGQDGAKDIIISLSTDSLSTILNPVDELDFIEGGQSDTLKFNIQAHNGWAISEVFEAKIDTAMAENTPEPDKILISSAIDSLDTVTVQRPAKMKILSVIPSQDTVRALIRDEWQIKIVVQDSGAGFIKLDQPSASDISILMEGVPQQDYTIVAPAGFENTQNLILSWWVEDTLIYRVARTGIMPGLGRIKVNLIGKYLNTDTPFRVSDSTGIYIQPSADVFIDITEPLCPNIDQYGIGHINTNQQFVVRSKIRNTGGGRVDNVKVNLTAPGYSIQPYTIQFIPQSGFAWVSFNIAAQQVSAERVNFIAKIQSATSHEGGLPATIGPASDSLAAVRIHKPALLKLSINRSDSIFSIGKIGSFRVSVENLGTAGVDSSGEICVEMPDGYHVVVNDQYKSADTTAFKINEQITWQVQPPQYMSNNDTIVVAISKPPLDKNTNFFALIENTDPFDTLIVKTIPSMLSINSFKITSPAGATDDTLSTIQDFWVQVNVSASENMSSIWAAITLPEGYGYGIGVDSLKYLVNNSASWKLKATENAHATWKWIKIHVTGTTGIEIRSVNDSIAVVTQNSAFMTFGRIDITWPGETDSILSVGQEFDLSATVLNSGEAKIEGTGYLKLNFGATGVTTVQNDTIKPFLPGIPVTWKLKAPERLTIKAPITVSIDTIPKDENTNEAARIARIFDFFYVETQKSGNAWIDSLWITSPSGALDKELSTYQTFAIEANVGWQNCNNISTTLHLTGGFTTPESNPKIPIGIGQQGRVSWTIRVPEEAKQHQPIWLTLSARDANSGNEFTVSSDSLHINVVNRAEIQLNYKIVSKSAQDNIVSTGQTFVIGAFLANSGQSKLTGNYSATMTLPEGQGYTLLDYQTLTAIHEDTLFWEIQAPLVEKESKNIHIQLVSYPKDENTSVSVVAEAILLKNVFVPIQTEEKTVTISNFPPRENYTIARGDTSIPMLGLELTCSGNANSNNVLLSGVKIKLKDCLGNLIINPANVISRLSIVKYQESSFVFGQVTNIPSENPIEILFSKLDTLRPELPEKIVFRVDVLANAKTNDFQLAIDSTDALYLIDEVSGQVPKLKNKSGQKLEALNIESTPSVIIESDFKKAFGNYPNPFGSPNRPQTKFIYYLDEDTDVGIQIYTLIGELVWSCLYTANDPQGKKGRHEGDIIWDGMNEKGYHVLNGVYIARISTSYGKNTLTKIAVIK